MNSLNEIYRIIDVNLNRSREALRVVEELARFYLNTEDLTKRLKNIRHSLSFLFDENKLLNARKTKQDLGKSPDFDNFSYQKVKELALANFRRAQEGCRVLEESVKLIPQEQELAKKIKQIRFEIYEIEKEMLSSFNSDNFNF